jgi:phosphonate transport system substrate-binding protein
MNRKSRLYPAFIALVCILSISIAALWETAAAQENSIRDFQKPQKFVIGIQPEKNIFEQRKEYKAIGRYIAKQLDIDVYIYTLPHYSSIFEAFNEGLIDAAFLGSFSYVLMRNAFPVELLVRPVWPDSSSTNRGYIVARKDSGIKTVADMEGKSLVLVDKATTAGYLYPLFFMKEHGVNDFEKFFSHVYFSGSHDGSAWAVYKGEAEVGACKDLVFQSLAGEYPQFKEQMAVLAESTEMPSNGLGVRSDLDKAFKEQLRDLLLSLDKSEEGRLALKGLGAVKFIRSGNEDYAPLYWMIDNLKLDLDNFPERD